MCKTIAGSQLDPSPGGTGPIVSTTTGAVLAPNIVGLHLLPFPPGMTDSCPTGAPSQICFNPNPARGQYVPASVSNPNTLCPSCQGTSDFERSIECCDLKAYSCGGTITADTTADGQSTKGTIQRGVDDGMKCLTNSPGNDSIVADDLQNDIGPARITARSGPFSGQFVTTSRSIATFPIIDVPITGPAGPTVPVKVVGFLQVFVGNTGSPGSFDATMLNVIGCGNNASGGTPIFRDTTSPIPVRLIH